MLGTRESYARLEFWARERLPLPGTLSHRVYRWAMVPEVNSVRRWLGHWLIRRPLLDVLGMSRLRVPLLVGPALSQESAEFFGALGIRPRQLAGAIHPSGTGQCASPPDFSIRLTSPHERNH